MHRALAILFFLAGCGGSGADVSGTVAGQGFTAGAAWWGANFIVLTETDYDCIDMSWVKSSYDDEHPPGDEAKRFLQFMFNSGGEVAKGVFTISETDESPVSAGFWNYTGARARPVPRADREPPDHRGVRQRQGERQLQRDVRRRPARGNARQDRLVHEHQEQRVERLTFSARRTGADSRPGPPS